MEPANPKPKWKTFITSLYLILISGILVWFFSSHQETIAKAWQQLTLKDAIPIVGWGFIFFIGSTVLWANLQHKIQSVKHAPSLFVWPYLFMTGYLGRYIPGKIPLLVGRILFLEKYGYRKQAIVITSVYENLLAIANAAAVGSLLLFVEYSDLDSQAYLFAVAALFLVAGIVILLQTPLFGYFCETLLRLTKRESLLREHKLPSSKLISKLFLGYTITSVAQGMVLHSVASALFPSYAAHVTLSISGANIAAIAGILSIIAPAGLGVREGVITLFLSPYLPTSDALLVAVSYRICLTGIEILYFFISIPLRHLRIGSKP